MRGRTVLLTGAAGDIGSAIAKRLAKDGVRVVLSGRDEVALERLRAALSGDGHVVVVVDLTQRADVAAAVAKVVVRDRPRAIVNGRPMAPIAALVTLAPGLGARLVERTGGNAIFRSLAAERERG